MVSGSELPPCHMAIEFARSYGGEKIATVVASQILCGPIEAAFANGELAHSDETDDDFTTGGAHPGCAVVPAALASGEQFGINGAHFLRAVALGYDIAMRAMKTVGPGMKETQNLVGTMGATAASGCAARHVSESEQAPTFPGGPIEAGCGACRHQRRLYRQQPRYARYLSSALSRSDAARQDGLLPRSPR